ncbi:MAG: saccharopine dehydrogenase family protein [Bacteroidota bacterium]
MKTILLLGAGKSSGTLIQYLLNNSTSDGFILKVGDLSLAAAQSKVNKHSQSIPFEFSIENKEQREKEISSADLVISLLPPALHILAARDCVRFKKNLVTASYVSDEIKCLHQEAVNANILLLNECGLDPGIDHMSAMEIIHRIKKSGGDIASFKSYTGGLVAPESNDNPWGYKFTWNPRNVIVAGQGTAKYISKGEYKYIPYQRLFTEIEKVTVHDCGEFDGYANRDSLSYRKQYGLDSIPTVLRGTLRYKNYCAAWQVFVTLGLTDDSYKIENAENLTFAKIVESLLPSWVKGNSIAEKVAKLCGLDAGGEIMNMIQYTGIFEKQKTNLKNVSPAQVLQHLLEQKWVLKEGDKDMIVMQHIFEYQLNGETKHLTSSLVVKGDDTTNTAMAKTVGLPLAIAARHILRGDIKLKGVQIPVIEELYQPILKELSELGIQFTESES